MLLPKPFAAMIPAFILLPSLELPSLKIFQNMIFTGTALLKLSFSVRKKLSGNQIFFEMAGKLLYTTDASARKSYGFLDIRHRLRRPIPRAEIVRSQSAGFFRACLERDCVYGHARRGGEWSGPGHNWETAGTHVDR